jgi:predicted transposase YbfD/YdcC
MPVHDLREMTHGGAVRDWLASDRSREITAIPALLDALLLKGAIVTIDAAGCQARIAGKIIEAQAEYVLAVKKNRLFEVPPLGDRNENDSTASQPPSPAHGDGSRFRHHRERGWYCGNDRHLAEGERQR